MQTGMRAQKITELGLVSGPVETVLLGFCFPSLLASRHVDRKRSIHQALSEEYH